MKKHVIQHIPLFIAVLFFIGYGTFHIAQFETTDEHFWKYDRINKYYNGLQEGFTHNNWKKTHINDKPGITVALIAGIGKLYGPNPESHIDDVGEKKYTFYDEKTKKTKSLYDMYHTELTEKINFSLRYPILLFNALIILPLIYYLLYSLTKNFFITNTTIILIGLNPIIIGISQIINPDALLWGTSSIALLAFATHLYRKEKKFLIIASLFTGFALLSKYTANLLFLFYPALFVLYIIFEKKHFSWRKDGVPYIKSFLIIFIISCSLFIIFMPSIFHAPHHFLYGTIYSPTLSPIVDTFLHATHLKNVFYISPTKYKTIPIGIISFLIFICITILVPLLCAKFLAKKINYIKKILNTGILFLMFIFVFSLINAWTNTPFFSLDDIKENSRVSGTLQFPDFASNPAPLFYLKALTVQAQNFIFSLSPLIVFLVFFLWFILIKNTIHNKKFIPIIYLLSLMPFVFIVGGLLADIFVNVRYSIMLYVPYTLLGGIALYELSQKTIISNKISQNTFYFITLLCLITIQFFALWTIKPFYFNYTSILLPKKYVVTDSWGYGAYEAAQYLNAQQNATEKVIWTDHRAICQFFIGKCIVSNELYLEHTPIDYFVFSRRGMITKSFHPIGNNPHNITKQLYYDENFLQKQTVFNFPIGKRPKNFIKVVKVKK
ncbi:MAG: hypothetical protein CR972_03275 [Candidatus Moraniibacteriota bacterium]|nr:MAG: hypothetical protein CR972_03275 [Candidatus Moranbacteria bacterium]